MSQRSAVRMGRAGPNGVFLRWGSRGGRVLRGAGPEDLRNIKWLFSFVSLLIVRPVVGFWLGQVSALNPCTQVLDRPPASFGSSSRLHRTSLRALAALEFPSGC